MKLFSRSFSRNFVILGVSPWSVLSSWFLMDWHRIEIGFFLLRYQVPVIFLKTVFLSPLNWFGTFTNNHLPLSSLSFNLVLFWGGFDYSVSLTYHVNNFLVTVPFVFLFFLMQRYSWISKTFTKLRIYFLCSCNKKLQSNECYCTV